MSIKHLNQQELADRWDLSERTLERWRSIGWGPYFLKVGGRVVYRLEDIEAYEIQHMRASTSELVAQSTLGGAI